MKTPDENSGNPSDPSTGSNSSSESNPFDLAPRKKKETASNPRAGKESITTADSTPASDYTWLELFKIFNEGLISRVFWVFTLALSCENMPAIACDNVQQSLRSQWNKASGKRLQKIYFIMLLLHIDPCTTAATDEEKNKLLDFTPNLRLFYRLAGGSFFKSLKLKAIGNSMRQQKWLNDQQHQKFRLFFPRPTKTASSTTAVALTTHNDIWAKVMADALDP